MSEQKVKTHRVFKRRWYILALYCNFCSLQVALWNTISPITYSVRFAYDWSDASIALLVNWSPIASIMLSVPFSYLFKRAGPRYSILFGVFLMTVGSALRTLTTDGSILLILCHIGQFMNGAAAIVAMSFPPLVAANWFPENERIFATALSQSFAILGAAISAALGPVWVPFDEKFAKDTVPTEDDVKETIRNIHNYFIVETSTATASFLLMLAYFPSHPPVPVSATEDKKTIMESKPTKPSFWENWMSILKKHDAWRVCFGMAVSGGLMLGAQGIMAIQMEPLGISDTELGRVGFSSFFAEMIATFVTGLSINCFRDKIKTATLFLLSISFTCFAWLSWLIFHAIPYSVEQLYIIMTCGSASYYACFPLFLELSISVCSDAPKEFVGVFLTAAYNLCMFAFLFIKMLPLKDLSWMNYLPMVGMGVGIILISLVQQPKKTSCKPKPDK